MIYPQNFEPKIGFDQIRQLLSEKCLSTLGAERVADMTFSDHFEEVEERLNLVTEFVRIIQEEDNFPAQYFFDVRPSLKRIRIEGMYLDEQELFDLRRSLETIRDIVRFLEKDDIEGEDSPYPCLRNLAKDILVFPQLIQKINNILSPYGKIKDNASSELARIRRELANTMNSISRSLNSILRNAQSEGVVDKDVTPTMRDGRLVGTTSLSTYPSDWALRSILFSEREMLPIVLANSRRMRASSVEALSFILPYLFSILSIFPIN